jgi:hypothetical protein
MRAALIECYRLIFAPNPWPQSYTLRIFGSIGHLRNTEADKYEFSHWSLHARIAHGYPLVERHRLTFLETTLAALLSNVTV